MLLVDCDLRKPKVHKTFNINNVEGLTNLLVGNKSVEEVAYKYEGLENLYIRTSGPIPPNPAELLASKRMEDFITDIKKDFDMIILDTPPVGLVTDSAVLSTVADGLILVTAVAQTEIGNVVIGKELLNKVKANIIGVVLNKVPIENRAYSKYGYYKYYGYYGE